MELAVSDLVMTFLPADAHPAKMMDGSREGGRGEGRGCGGVNGEGGEAP